MKIRLSVLLIIVVSIAGNAQSLQTFDTNGPVGECLFNQDEDGNIVYTGIVKSTYGADTLIGLAEEFIYKVDKEIGRSKISNKFTGMTFVACDMEIDVGTRKFDLDIPLTWTVSWQKAASTIKFHLVIDARDGKYRYTLSDFITDRGRIPGEAKDTGPSNLLHWQRLNSLNKQLDRSRDKEEIEKMIENEKVTYQLEYETIQYLIKKLENFAVIEDF